MNKHYLILALGAMMFTPCAQSQSRLINPEHSVAGSLPLESQQILMKQTRAESGSCKITLKDKAEGGSYDDGREIMVIPLGGGEGYSTRWEGKLKKATVDVIPGEYDIVIPMRVNGMKAWVFRENVDVQEDMTISVAASEASALFTFNPLDESGTRLEGPVYDYYETFDVADGPQRAAAAYKFLYHNEIGEFYMLLSELGIIDFGPQDGSMNLMDEEVFYMSPNTHFSVHAVYFFNSDHGQYAISLGSKGCDTQTLSNDPAQFVTVDNTMVLSPAADMKRDVTYEGFATVYDDDVATSSWSSVGTPGIMANKFFVYSNPDNDCKAEIMVIPMTCEYMVEEMFSRTSYNLVGAPFRIVDGTAVHIATGAFNGRLSNQFTCNPDGEYSDLSVCCDLWSYTHPDTGITYGNSCPTLLSIPYVSKKKAGIDIAYIGRFDETKNLDVALAEVLIEKDGNKEYEGDLSGSQDYWLKAKAGAYTMTVTDENVLVDDIEGKNVTVMTFNPTADDPTPPGIGALRFADQDGVITDRFADNADGTLLIAAGDNSYGENGRTFVVTDDVKSIKVEYAPYGSEDFEEIPVNPTGDLYSHRYGQTYTGDLIYVQKSSPCNWYDLRVSICDNADNTCIQTISPAFRIEQISGIKGINETDSRLVYNDDMIRCDGLVEVFDAAGVMVAASRDGFLSTSSLDAGVYIVKNGSGRIKIAVK